MLTRERDRTGRSRTSTDECDYDDSDDIEHSHTHAGMSGTKVANSESSTRMDDISVPRSRKIVTVVLTIEEDYHDDTIVGAADGVDTPLSLQRVIDRCSFSELELKRLYRRAVKKDKDAKQSGISQCLTD